ncbi:MAG: lipoprotein [Leptospira sp.]|nr:lipoprotein [Leptospira sp.]
MKLLKLFFLFYILFFLTDCRDPDFHVRGAKVTNAPQKKLMVGSIQNRDFKTPKSIAKDFRDLFAFELMQKGYSLIPVNVKMIERDMDLSGDKSSLPLSLRKSAGEASIVPNQLERLLDKNEIKSITQAESVDLFVQGVVSIQSNEKILDRKDYNYIFLNVYDTEGNLVGMVNSSFDERILGESDLMRKVASSLAQTFDKSMK